MQVRAIDHVNHRIPADGVDDALAFYRDLLGLETENVGLYEAGEKGFFSFRLSPESVIHVQPVADFRAPDGHGYDHVALCVEASIDEVTAILEDAGVEIEAEIEPLGATGVAPAVYVSDPFGYRLELKETN